MEVVLQRARRCAPTHARTQAGARKRSAQGASAKTALAPGQRNTPDALPPTTWEEAHKPQDDPKRERGRARGAAPPDGGARVERPTREKQRNATHTTLPVEFDPRESRVGPTGRNRGRYSPQCATALAGSPKPLEPTQLLIQSPRRRAARIVVECTGPLHVPF